VKKKLEIPSFDKKFSGVPSKIFLSLLHSIGIQLIPVEFWLRPQQARRQDVAAGGAKNEK